MANLSRLFCYKYNTYIAGPTTPSTNLVLGLGSSAFAHRYLRNHCCFLFLQVLRCFTSLGSPPVFQALSGSPIRISTDLQSFASPRSFSQLTTSFFASCCLGIPRMPFFLWTLCTCQLALVGQGGFEPPTSRLSGVRSHQLSYRPILFLNKYNPQSL